MNRDLSQHGRSVLITGASQGLGREIARGFLATGADVAICARTSDDLEATAAAFRQEFPSRKIFALSCDIGKIAEIDDFYDAAIKALDRIDVVINNAGVHGPIGAIDEVDWAAWQRAIMINLLGTAYSCRRAIQHFKSRNLSDRRGKILILSGGGATAPQPGLSAYGAAKAGLVRLAETLAEEVRPHRVDVNAIAPGALATRLLAELKAAGPQRIGAQYHSRVEEISARGGMSMSRAVELCLYLGSAASDGITGRLISAAWDPWPFTAEITAALASSDIYTLRRIVPEDRGQRWEKP